MIFGVDGNVWAKDKDGIRDTRFEQLDGRSSDPIWRKPPSVSSS